jgi:para-aminobenzoate synthetase component I
MNPQKLIFHAFLKLRHLRPILMQSAEGWSFICIQDEVQPEWGEELELTPGRKLKEESDLPFAGGWLGFVSYNQGCEWMGVESRWKSLVPKMWWKFCSRGVAISPEGEVRFFGEGCEELEELMEGLEKDFCPDRDFDLPEFKMGEVESNIGRVEYDEGISEVKKLLRDGETYQVNFAQEFVADFEGDAFGLYMKMFEANPSEMCFFAEGDGWSVCSNSPERLFSLRDGVLKAEPIKGTVARGEDPEFLLKDEKTYAELTMIVDLLRNDLGKVAKVGSVRVPEHQTLMELSNVWHTYSVVEAGLAEGKNAWDVLKALFPGGSIVGCPKKRTMEIIDRLVDFSWGAYCGSAGYVSLNGNADFNIMIRTAQVVDGKARFGAGGGIVMDSDAGAEYQESLDKAEIFTNI